MTIVTHHAPDLDAICAVWLIKRFLPNWQEASVAFVPAGETLNKEPVDSDLHVMHVDTGLGWFDHHQSNEDTCASIKVYQYLKSEIDKSGRWEDEALERMSEVVNFYDHFREVSIPDTTADYHLFDVINILDGLKNEFDDNDQKLIDAGFLILDGVYKAFKERIWAEEIMKEGVEFATQWGKGIAFETLNDAVLKFAQKSRFVVAIRKDPKKAYVRIKGMPETEVDFTQIYKKLLKKDPDATWYLHPSKKILLNGTTKNPDMKPTKLSLNDIIKIIKN